MSIYSGFATRFQQQSYDHCLDSLLYILQKRIIKFYQNDQADEQKFISLVLKLHTQMKNMEKSKYLEPKSSQSINQLIKFMQLFLQNSASYYEHHERQKEELHKIDQNSLLPQVSHPTKKKSIYWVEKPSNQQSSNKGSSQRDIKTMDAYNYDVKAHDGNIELRKTSYNPAYLRGVKIKNGSKSNMSRQRKQQKQLTQVKPPKNKSVSGYIHDKPLVQSKITQYAQSFRQETEQNLPRHKNKSHHKVNQPDAQSLMASNHEIQVADIIRQYITKAKKVHLQGRLKSDERSPASRMHDF